MIELLMILSMSSLNTPTVDFQPCVWPNPCGAQEETIQVADYQICIYPNPCSLTGDEPKEDTVLLAGGFEICVYPNPCSFAPGKETETELI